MALGGSSQAPIPLNTFGRLHFAAVALTDMAEQIPIAPGMDQTSSFNAPLEGKIPAVEGGTPPGAMRPPHTPSPGRGAGRGQKPHRGRQQAQRTPPSGRDHNRASAGPDGRQQGPLRPGRRAGSVVNLKESFGFVK